MRPLHAHLSPRLWRRLSFSNHEANDQTGIDFRGENASIQTYRDVETGQRPCDVRNAHARRDFLIGNDERTGGKPPFGLRPTVGNRIRAFCKQVDAEAYSTVSLTFPFIALPTFAHDHVPSSKPSHYRLLSPYLVHLCVSFRGPSSPESCSPGQHRGGLQQALTLEGQEPPSMRVYRDALLHKIWPPRRSMA